MKLRKLVSTLMAAVMVLGLMPAGVAAEPAPGTVYEKVTSQADIEAGGEYLLVSGEMQGKYYAMGQNSTVHDWCMDAVEVPVQNGTIPADGLPAGVLPLMLEPLPVPYRQNYFPDEPVYNLSARSETVYQMLGVFDVMQSEPTACAGGSAWWVEYDYETLPRVKENSIHVAHTQEYGDLVAPAAWTPDPYKETMARMRFMVNPDPDPAHSMPPLFTMLTDPAAASTPTYLYRLNTPASGGETITPAQRFSSGSQGITLNVEAVPGTTDAFVLKFSGDLKPGTDGRHSLMWNWDTSRYINSVNYYTGSDLQALRNAPMNGGEDPSLEAVGGQISNSVYLDDSTAPVWYEYYPSYRNSADRIWQWMDLPIYFRLDLSRVRMVDEQGQDSNPVSVDGITYPTLDQAIEAMGQEGVVTLLRDLELNSAVTIPAGKNVTLDLNGCSIRLLDPIDNSAGMLKVVNWNPEKPACHIQDQYRFGDPVFTDMTPDHLLLCAGIYDEEPTALIVGQQNNPNEPVITQERRAYPVKQPGENLYWMVGEPMRFADQRLTGIVPTDAEGGLAVKDSSQLVVGKAADEYILISLEVGQNTLASLKHFGYGLTVNATQNWSCAFGVQLTPEDVAKLGTDAHIHLFREGETGYMLNISRTDEAMTGAKVILPAGAGSPDKSHMVFGLSREGKPEELLTSAWPQEDPEYGRCFILDCTALSTAGSFGIYENCPHPAIDYYEGYEATCTREGMQEAWHCSTCGSWYSDAQFAHEIHGVHGSEGLATRRAFHSDYDGDGICNVCGNPMPFYKAVTAQDQITENGIYLAVTEYDGAHFVLKEPELTQDPYIPYLPSAQVNVTAGENGEQIITYDDYIGARRSRAMDLKLDRPYQNFDPAGVEYGLKGAVDERWYAVNNGNSNTDFWFGGEKYDVVSVTVQQDQTRVRFSVGGMDLTLKGAVNLVDYGNQVMFMADFPAQEPAKPGEKPYDPHQGAERLPVRLYQLVETVVPQPAEHVLTVVNGTAAGLNPIPGELQNKYTVAAGDTVSLTASVSFADPVWTSDPAGVEFTPTPTGCTFVMPDHDVTVTAEQAAPLTPIEFVNLTVTEPAIGAQPDTNAVTDDVGYTVTRTSWNNETPTFMENTRYTVTIELTADEGYQFTARPAATVNDNQAWASAAGAGTLTVEYTFPAMNPAPVAHSITVTGGKAYQQLHDGDPRLEVTSALEGSWVELDADTREGYEFKGWDGLEQIDAPGSAKTGFVMPDHDVTITARFAKIGDGVQAAAVTVDTPAAQAAPDVLADVVYTVDRKTHGETINAIAEAVWSPAADQFDYNTAYTVTVTLTAPEGCFYTGNSRFTINDQPAAVVSAVLDGQTVRADSIPDGAESVTLSYTFPATGEREYLITTVMCSADATDATGATQSVESAVPGTQISLMPWNPPRGQEFDHYETVGVTLDDPNDRASVFTMPENDVTVTAVFRDIVHEHQISSYWISDSTDPAGHWHECEICGIKMGERVPHDFGDGWYFSEDGKSEIRVCRDCGYSEVKPRSEPVVVGNYTYNVIEVPPAPENTTIVTGTQETECVTVTYDQNAVESIIQQAGANQSVGLNVENVTGQTAAESEHINEAQQETIEDAGQNAVYSLKIYVWGEGVPLLEKEIDDFGQGRAVIKVPVPKWAVPAGGALCNLKVERIEADGTKTEMKDVWLERDEDGKWYVYWRTDGHSLYMLTDPSKPFARLTADDTGVELTVDRTCTKGQTILVAGYEGGRMVDVKSYRLEADVKAGAAIRIEAPGFGSMTDVKAFLMNGDQTPAAGAAVKK